MIKCKEDLINTYIENDHGELRDLYLSKCVEFKIGWVSGKEPFEGEYGITFDVIGVNSQGDLCKVHDKRYLMDKKLTLSDLKPRTRTEYEKVTESIFDLRDEFERGELYGDDNGVTKIETLAHLGACCQAGNAFKKVEKEIDERQDFIDRFNKITDENFVDDVSYIAMMMYDAGCRFQD